MLPLNLDDLTADHVHALISEEAEETLTLEFKESLPGPKGDNLREILYDIAAMANAAGGDLIFGIADKRDENNQPTGVAEKLAGLKIGNGQAEISRIDNAIRDSIDPRISGVQYRVIAPPEGDVLIVRIPRSWNGPHMVTHTHANKFYSRNSTSKFLMSVSEIGQAFAQQRILGERLSEWRSERINNLLNLESPLPLSGTAILVVHLIPALALLQPNFAVDWHVPQDQKNNFRLLSHDGIIGNVRYNANGFLMYPSFIPDKGAEGYTQLFRNGIFEYVDTSILNSGQRTSEGENVIPSVLLEQAIVLALENAWNLMPSLRIQPPVYMAVSLLNIKGSIMPHGGRWMMSPLRFTDHVVMTPDIQIDSIDEERPYESHLLPLINSIWQASGLERTPYMKNGAWEPYGYRGGY